jgi:hypothetical protein
MTFADTFPFSWWASAGNRKILPMPGARDCEKSSQAIHVAVYEVAHLQGAPRLLRGMIVSGMRKGVPPEQEERFLVVTEKEDEWKRWANFREPDNAYVLILNKSAEATWRTHESLNDKILEYTKAEVLTLNAH